MDYCVPQSVHWHFIHVCFIQVTMCGACNARWCAHFSIHFKTSWIRQQISVGKCAHQGAWAPSGATVDVPNCHLDKTNMDNSSMHPLESRVELAWLQSGWGGVHPPGLPLGHQQSHPPLRTHHGPHGPVLTPSPLVIPLKVLDFFISTFLTIYYCM